MITLKQILCPVDFSDASDHAVELAGLIARWYDARITALHVAAPVVVPFPGLPAGGYAGNLSVEEAERRRLCEATARAFHAAVAADTSVDVQVPTGQPAGEILDYANRLPADLIVMGTHGAGGFQHLVLGSVTEKVLRKARCPVLTVPPRAQATSRLPFKQMLCAVDFSESSLTALGFGLSLAKEADAQLTILHVLEWPWEEPPAPRFEQLPVEQAFSLAAYRREREKDAARQLAALVPADARDWCSPATRIAHGRSYEQILRVAAEEHSDLIVMGVRGRSALDIAVFGSTTNHMVRTATCPVLTLRH
jgi:nucleotide-binding universal stress UspA family protein